jgi:hypothetical protein
MVTSPNFEKISLFLRCETDTNLKFLLTQENLDDFLTKNNFGIENIFASDVYSLAICVLNFVYPFPVKSYQNVLSKEALKKNLNFIKDYYSPQLFNIIEKMVSLENKNRIHLKDLVKELKNF